MLNREKKESNIVDVDLIKHLNTHSFLLGVALCLTVDGGDDDIHTLKNKYRKVVFGTSITFRGVISC